MNIVLTGKPGIGKSSVVSNFIKGFDGTTIWMLTRELLDDNRQRAGFISSTSASVERLISHKTDIKSDTIIGSNHVDMVAVKEILDAIKHTAETSTADVVVLDEIGPIQLTEPAFLEEFDDLFNGKTNLLASVHFDDERLTKYRQSPDAINITVTEDNRDTLPEILKFIFSNLKEYGALTANTKRLANSLAQGYIEKGQWTQLNKLFTKGIDYYGDNRVSQVSPTQWSVAGEHGTYVVNVSDNQYSCNCDLYLGLNQYANNPGECSHIQSVKLLRS